MYQAQKLVIVMERDPQILKGLVLMLADMQLSVVSASSPEGLDYTKMSPSQSPSLLIFPLEVSPHRSGSELVAMWREYFKTAIPSILISQHNSIPSAQTISPNTVVLSDRIKPRDLRQKIDAMLAQH